MVVPHSSYQRTPRYAHIYLSRGWIMEEWRNHERSRMDFTASRWINRSTRPPRFHKLIFPQHTELKSLVWALECLSRHQRFYDYFVTDSQEFVKMIFTSKDWLTFAAELNEFKSKLASYQSGKVVYQPITSNNEVVFLVRHARTRNYVNTSVPQHKQFILRVIKKNI